MNRATLSGGAWPAVLLLLLGFPAGLLAQAGSSSWPPVASGEKLRFNLLWPSGFSLGEAVLEASGTGEQIQLQATVQADLPQHPIEYSFSSSADEQLCSLRYRETLREGNNTRETSYEFDQENHKVRRTEGGQSSESSIPECARDPLALLLAERLVRFSTARQAACRSRSFRPMPASFQPERAHRGAGGR